MSSARRPVARAASQVVFSVGITRDQLASLARRARVHPAFVTVLLSLVGSSTPGTDVPGMLRSMADLIERKRKDPAP